MTEYWADYYTIARADLANCIAISGMFSTSMLKQYD